MKSKLFVMILFLSFMHSLKAQDLLETYRQAVQNDPFLKKSFLIKSSAKESREQSVAKMLPNISITGNSGRNRINNTKATFQGNGIQNYWDHGFTINLAQPVFHWEHWLQLSQSDNKIAQAEAEYEAENQKLIVRTAESYFNILSAQDALSLNLAEKRAIKRQLGRAQQRFNVGLISITGVYEAQAAYDQARANEIDAENELSDTKEALAEIIGINEGSINPLSKAINLIPPEPNDMAKWVEISESNNLKIIAALNQMEIDRKNISIMQSDHLPTIDLVANYNAQDVNSSFGLRGDTQSVGLQINIPLYQGGLVQSRSRQAQIDYQIAKQNLLGTKRRVKHELRNAFRDINSNLVRVQALRATVISAEKALEAIEAGFGVGIRTMFDVLTEQKKLYLAKREFSRSQYDYLVDGIKLKQAAGSLSEKDIQVINQYF